MNLGIKLNLNAIANHTFTETEVLTFSSISDLDNYAYIDTEFVRRIKITVTSTSKKLEIFTNSLILPSHELDDNAIVNASEDGRYIIFKCSITDSSNAILLKWISLGLIEINQFGKTTMFAYRLNDEADHITKSLTFVTVLEGKFSAPVGIKTLELDVIDYNIDNTYNYIYIPKLKRYYYIDNVVLTTKDYTRLVLKEDVLMSWASLIRSQSALVTRYEGATDKKLYDNRFPVEDVITVEYPTLTATSPSNKNTNLNASLNLTDYTFLVSFIGFGNENSPTAISSPTGTNLNSITAVNSPKDNVEFLKYEDMKYFIEACQSDSGSASFIKSVLCLPFNPSGVLYPSNQSTHQAIQVPDGKSLRTNYRFEPASDVEHAHVFSHYSKNRACPYIITADFTVSGLQNSFIYYEPNSNYEIYIAFVGWVQINANQIIGKRLMVYYTIDYETGSGTAYIYNVTDDKLVWSSNCQIGVKIDFTTTNALEISKQKSANELNTILNSIGGLLAMVGGGVSGNALAVAGGGVTIAKTVASSINLHNSLFQTAQISFGTSEGVIHTSFENNGVVVRRSYHKPLVSVNTYFSNTVYEHIEGLPYNSYVAFSNLTKGKYIEVGDIHFDYGNENIYTEEVMEIVVLLKNGVIL